MALSPSRLPQYAILISLIAISFPLQLLARASEHVDGTLISRFSGVNVVVAVIEKIDASEVFQDYDWFRRNKGNVKAFLRRMAYVESEDGRIMSPGGIWNIISEDELRKTQVYADESPSGQTLRQRIQDSSLPGFVDWMNVTFNGTTNNLSIPLYSGLATMIRLHKLINDDRVELSNSHTRQAELWRNNFNGTTNAYERWNSAENHLTRNEDCAINTDVVFVVDTSNSISESNLTQARNMIYNFTNMTISNEHDESGYNKVGIVLIRSTAFVYHPLHDNLNKEALLRKIKDLPYKPGEYTNTADGLCKMSRQAWREDSSVLHLAIVITDGRSNYISGECRGGTEHVANLIHTEHPHILVMAIGIGHRIDINELSLIASGRHLVVELAEYKETVGIPASLRYQICYTLSEPITEQDENRTVLMKRDQIMRWIRNGVGGEGVTIRLCIRDGKVTLYVSSLPNPSDAEHDYRETITPDNNIAILCTTKHLKFKHRRPIPGRRRRDQVPEASIETIYITVVGQDNSSLVTLQTANGNVTFDVNECEQEPYPCDESAICHNTDGSFYCECQEGFSGDGFECTGQGVIYSNRNQLEIILPSCILGVIILLSALLALLVSIITWRKSKKHKSIAMSTQLTHLPQFHQSEIKLAKANLKKVGNTFSATNAIFEK